MAYLKIILTFLRPRGPKKFISILRVQIGGYKFFWTTGTGLKNEILPNSKLRYQFLDS
jgi:hypothetical protein